MIADAEAQALEQGLREQLQRTWNAQDALFRRLGKERDRIEEVAAAIRTAERAGPGRFADLTRELVLNEYTMHEIRQGFRRWVES